MPKLPILITLSAIPVALPAQEDAFTTVAWLVGCWERTAANGRAVEKWFSLRNGAMQGTSQVMSGGATRETERLRIFASGGALVYEAHPAGQHLAQFRAREATSTTAVFVNPEHDYPQQIAYSRTGTDSLVARIEGDRAGRRGPRTFQFRRAVCPEVELPPATVARLALEPKYDQAERLEERTFAGYLDWFADSASPGYRHVRWAAPGNEVSVRDAATLRQVAQALRDANAVYRPRDRRYEVTLERLLVRGDTAETLVTALRTWRIADEPGHFGLGGAEHERAEMQRWLDTWVREGGEWGLRWTRLLFEEVMLDGRVTVRDGRPVAGGTP